MSSDGTPYRSAPESNAEYPQLMAQAVAHCSLASAFSQSNFSKHFAEIECPTSCATSDRVHSAGQYLAIEFVSVMSEVPPSALSQVAVPAPV